MKNLLFYYCCLFLFFYSCETEFPVHADWQETMVVYGLLDQTEDRQYIKINKAYLGEGNALQMASIPDSINYDPDNLQVTLAKIQPNGDTQTVITLYDTIMEKEAGLFSIDSNIIYTFRSPNFLEGNREYHLNILNTQTGNIVSAETKLIQEINVEDYWNVAPNYTFNFWFGEEYSDVTIEWSKSNNAAVYQVTLGFNYVRITQGLVVDTISLNWVFPLMYNSANLRQEIKGLEFFNFLNNNPVIQDEFSSNASFSRRALSLNLQITAGTQDLYEYMALSSPSLGIIQERPFFTNIENGIGLFSSRYNWRQYHLPIHSSTKSKIAIDLEEFNFIP